jgi:biopolymer transport protein TolR
MAGTGDQGGAAINVVPLIDIVLVLLIIFMVVTPMLQKGVDVKLPKATNVDSKDGRTSDDQVIAVRADKALFLMKDKLTEDELKTALASLHQSSPFTPILVKGDERVSYGDVRKIVLMAQEAGFKVVNIATESKTDKAMKPEGG